MKKIMTRAWEIAKNAVAKFGGKAVEYFSEALKLAWKEVKEMKMNVEEKLLELGGNMWEKYGKRRIYINKDLAFKLYGLEVSFYNSGAPSSAKLDGETISNSSAKGLVMMLKGTYYDLDKKEFGFGFEYDPSEETQKRLMANLAKL